MEEVYGCGTGLIATAHAKDIEDLTGRKGYRRLIDGGVFRNAVLIQMKDGKRHYEIRSLA
jgi:stage III sporulation protein SpoIIIAA